MYVVCFKFVCFVLFFGPSRCGIKVKQIIQQITLEEKTDSMATTLSGGQKRKLSVGIALIGNPRVGFIHVFS